MTDHKFRDTAVDLLGSVGITIDGPNPWDMQVHDERLYARVFADGKLGFGESYMDGWWDAEDLDETMNRILSGSLQSKLPRNLATLKFAIEAKWTNRQNQKRAWRVGDQHYNLGNDLFAATFDTRLTGSCGYWKNIDPATDSDRALDEAQDAKLDLICRKIGLKEGQTVFDIGCGWGAFMGYAAEKYGARCTGVTISREQVAYIAERYSHLPVEARLIDYRDATGTYDHVVSMGMFEHVGPKNYKAYFETADRLLKDGGLFLLHTIGSNESVDSINPWMDKYIFENGVLPSVAQIANAIEGLFMVEDWHNFGSDYDKTLMAWYRKFESNWDSLKDKYDERFYRMWKFYLLACAGGFRARSIQLWQVVLAKRGVDGGYTTVR
jgi:cyclopropane-fatty-acyl-phospholipid synthase